MTSLSPISRLTAELGTVKELVLENSRRTDELLRLFTDRPARAAAARGPPAVDDNELYPLHLRFFFDVGDAYLACLVYDIRTSDGGWKIRADSPFAVTVRVRKTDDIVRLVETEHGLTATDIVRVWATVDPQVKIRKNRTLSGLQNHKHDKDEGGERRCPKKPKYWTEGQIMCITFTSLERIANEEGDVEKIYALAAEMFPPSDGVTGMLHALSAGLMMPRDEDAVDVCLQKLGVSATDAMFFAAAVDAGAETGATARVASDPRFAPLLDLPRATPSNVRVRNLLDRARAWTPDAEVLPPCIRVGGRAPPPLEGVTIPFLIKPVPAAPAAPSGVFKLRDVHTGVYAPLTDRRGCLPRAFVRRDGGVSVVVGYAYAGVFHPGADKMPLGEDISSHAWHPPYLSLADTFCTRLESLAFDGEPEWSNAELRHALGMAKRVQWAFKDPAGDKAGALYARLKTCARI